MNIHELKTWPNEFEAILNGSKSFELRKNDRDFKCGDFLLLKEWCPQTEQYSGRSLMCECNYILKSGIFPGLNSGYVIMNIKRI